MRTAPEVFLSKLIDYAGIFPPANLELSLALSNYRSYIQSNHNWIISKFIISSTDLKKISIKDINQFNSQNLLNLSIISKNFNKDYNIINTFLREFSSSVKFSCLETQITNVTNFYNQMIEINDLIKKNKLNISLFFELLSKNWQDNIPLVIDNISRFNETYETNFGFKLRCGGIKKSSFPAPKYISTVLLQSIKRNIPMKFTAGLHHPYIYKDRQINTNMYGFFNVFLSGMFAKKYDLNKNDIIKILIDKNKDHFQFKENKIKWQSYYITKDEILDYRLKNFISFGSCSFDKPCEDLKDNGIL